MNGWMNDLMDEQINGTHFPPPLFRWPPFIRTETGAPISAWAAGFPLKSSRPGISPVEKQKDPSPWLPL